jgi:hypothetical protein
MLSGTDLHRTTVLYPQVLISHMSVFISAKYTCRFVTPI